MEAIIINNIPFCPKCNKPLERGINNYGLVEKDGKKYYKFERCCNNCIEFGEYLNLTYYEDIDFNNRYSFNKKEVKEING